MSAIRAIPTPYLIAGGAVAVLGVLATPLRRLLFNVPVLTAIGGALLSRKAESSEKPAPAKRSAPKAKRAKPARKAPARKPAANSSATA